MSYAKWLTLVSNAKKTSIVNGKIRKIHYNFLDGKEMVEEYNMETGLVVRRGWKNQKRLAINSYWEIELGEAIGIESDLPRFSAQDCDLPIRTGSDQPVVSKRITKINIEWRINNLPYGIDNYIVTANKEQCAIVVRTKNRKYYKNIPVPELSRCEIKPSDASISVAHQYNTLIITYKKPPIVSEMETAVLKELQNVETEPNLDTILDKILIK